MRNTKQREKSSCFWKKKMSQTLWRLWIAGSLAPSSVSSFLSPCGRSTVSRSWGVLRRHGGSSTLMWSKKSNHTLSSSSSSSSTTIIPAATTTASKNSNNNNIDQVRADAIAIGQKILQPKFAFPLDDWQLEAGGHVWNGHNVIVCAPTGAGKTVVGEMALHAVMQHQGQNGIYTTPLKALSNQKWNELRERFGNSDVGLSTGDISINRGARLTVMTTEVYRNMVWRVTSPQDASSNNNTTLNGNYNNSSTKTNEPPSIVERLQRQELERSLLNRGSELESNAVVVLDEFHYMGLAGRGGVWEEAIICSPAHTQIIGLSATLPNGRQLADWMQSVTGRTTMLVEAPGKRPVPLRYIFATRDGLFPLFRDPDAGPGAPKGLLGLRGDGQSDHNHHYYDKQKKKKKGFKADEVDDVDSLTKTSHLPHGLQPNPMLSVEAQKRLSRVNRAIQRQKVEAINKYVDNDDSDFEWDGHNQERRYNNNNKKRSSSSSQSNKPSFKMSAREERQQRERLLRMEMRKAVPSLSILLKRLQQKRLLPAIIFIFSRAGCDEAARAVCHFMKGSSNSVVAQEKRSDEFDGAFSRKKERQQIEMDDFTGDEESDLVEDAKGRSFRSKSNYVRDDVLEYSTQQRRTDELEQGDPLSPRKLQFYAREGLLNLDEVKTVAARIQAFNEENEEIKFSDDIVEQYLIGVGSHHAGMLPAHKAFVESLYRAQLMKAVFATETLAAGINMPARTTVICALAKRDDTSSMSLLETSNLLQMAGRAGRRGMDTDGTCVIVATPFETHEEAVMILTNPIKPITSQFTPSYSLAVNLIARGNGKLNVAKQLVSKSFAMWEKRKNEVDLDAEELSELLRQQRFMSDLIFTLNMQVEMKRTKYNVGQLKSYLDILRDRDLLKKWSKSYVGLIQKVELERATLSYLELEAERMTTLVNGDDEKLLRDLLEEDWDGLQDQLEAQRKRVAIAEKQIHKHPFSTITDVANEIIEEETQEGEVLRASLEKVRGSGDDESQDDNKLIVTAEELSVFSKSLMKLPWKNKKSANAVATVTENESTASADDSWNDMRSIIDVLVSYGCLQPLADGETDDEKSYRITQAGINLGMMGFSNSLWCLVAMGGAWDVVGTSAKLDAARSKTDLWDDDENGADLINDDFATSRLPQKQSRSQKEAESMVSLLRSLTPSEMAGFVSCLVAENSRGGAGGSLLDTFKQLPMPIQRTIQQSLRLMDRLAEVQKTHSVDDSIGVCEFDITHSAVVTAWAAGCTWNEALAMSGVAPGDLARILSRALDGLRQLGNLPYSPVRNVDGIPLSSPGIHPEVRRICRDAARAVNRYPVKDPLALEDPSVDTILVDINEEEEEEEDSDEESDSDDGIKSQN